jgi:hypothetical protein
MRMYKDRAIAREAARMLYEQFLFDTAAVVLPFPEATASEVLGWGFEAFLEREGAKEVSDVIIGKVKDAPDYLPPKRRERFYEYLRGQALPFAREFYAEDVNVAGCTLDEWEERWSLALAFSFMAGTRGRVPFGNGAVETPDTLRQGIGQRAAAERVGTVGEWDSRKALARVGAAYVKVESAFRPRYKHSRGAFFWMVHYLPPMAADAFNAAELAYLHEQKPEASLRDAAFWRALTERVEAHVTMAQTPIRGAALQRLHAVMVAARAEGADEFTARTVGLDTYRASFAEGLRALAREVEAYELPAEAIEQAEEKMHQEVVSATPLFLPNTEEKS